jgi:hypothetical protein
MRELDVAIQKLKVKQAEGLGWSSRDEYNATTLSPEVAYPAPVCLAKRHNTAPGLVACFCLLACNYFSVGVQSKHASS